MSDEVEARLAACLSMAEALIDAMEVAARSGDETWRFASFGQFMLKADQLFEMTEAIEHINAPIDRYNRSAIPRSSSLTIVQQREFFESVRSNLFILRAYLTSRVNPKGKQASEIADFIQANLRRATLKTPEREKDVQDTIEQLFIGRGLEKGIDYDREKGRVKVSTKEVIPDFILPQLATAIEVKLLKDPKELSNFIDQINADIVAYGQGYSSIIFVVYDIAGAIRDESEFRGDLEATSGVKVLVCKH